MRIVEKSVSAGDREVFDLDEFLSRPLYAHLAHNSEQGPRESPVWFHWDGQAIWIIGGSSFPANLRRDPRCAVGIVDWDPATGLSQHVGFRGTAEVLPYDGAMALTIFRRYFGPDESEWDKRFGDLSTGGPDSTMVRIVPETVVVRDQSYKPTKFVREKGRDSRDRVLHRAVRIVSLVHRRHREVSVMSRLLWSLAFGACSLLVAADACAAPAPFPKTNGTTDPLFAQMRKAVNACGYQLHEMRPGPKADEFSLVISARNLDNPVEKAARVTTISANVKQLLNPEALELILILAMVKGGGELSLQEQLGYPCRTLRH